MVSGVMLLASPEQTDPFSRTGLGSSCGDRDANSALYVIAVCRMSHDERIRTYVARHTKEDKTK